MTNRDVQIEKIKVSVMSILKGLGVSIPIIVALLIGYTNIMTKLTELDMKISANNEQHVIIFNDIKDLKEDYKKLRENVNYYIATDDTKVKQFKE